MKHRALLFVLRGAWLALMLVLLGLFLAGQGPRIRELSAVCEGDACPLVAPSPAEDEVLQDAGFTLRHFALLHQTFEVLVAGTMLAFAVVIFLARFDDWFGVLVSFTIMTFGLNFMVEADNALIQLYPAWRLPHELLSAVTAVLFVLLLYLFPDGRFTPTFTKFAAALLAVFAVADAVVLGDAQIRVTFGLPTTLVYLASLCLGMGAQIYRYRRVSSPTARQQTKWVLYGITMLAMAMIIYSLFVELLPPSAGRPRLLFNTVGFALMVPIILLFPLSMMFSILRYRLWDIDLVINRTLVYGALTVLLLLLFLVSITLLQVLFVSLTGQDSQAAIVLSTLLITVLFNPLRRRLQRLIDRRFYRRKYDAARVLERFAQTARDEVDLHALSAELMGTVQYAVQPNQASLWLRSDGADRESGRTRA